MWARAPRSSEFLAPFFFFTIGSRLNVHLFAGNVLYTAVVISLLAIVSKVVGCGVPLWREGRLSALQVGVGMMPRGEVALIVALIGLRSHIVLPATYAIVVFMTAVTTILALPLLRYLYRGEMKTS